MFHAFHFYYAVFGTEIAKIKQMKDIPKTTKYPQDVLQLKKETAVNQIIEQLEVLQEIGQINTVYPIFEQVLKNDIPEKTSRLVIDADYRIFLPDYKNREIKLSCLTKAVYFLFLKHRNGIYLPDLHLYREELLHLYCNISNQLAFDKMQQSILKITTTPNELIYQHLSRIKTAFIKSTNSQYAKNYYICGTKNTPKKINLPLELIVWEIKL